MIASGATACGCVERRFEAADQQDFAALTGDRNPLHLDPLFARRTPFGVPIVHGAHLALWALDRLPLPALEGWQIAVRFIKPVAVGEAVKATLEAAPDGWRIVLTVGARLATRIALRPDSGREPKPARLPDCGEAGFLEIPEVPLDRPMGALAGERLRLRIEASAEAYERRFPDAARRLGGAEVLQAFGAVSCLVGMVNPGLHSLFLQCTLARRIDGAVPPGVLWAEVTAADRRFDSLEIAFATASATGTLSAYLRRPPVAQPSLDTLRPLVEPDRFAGQQALVIGGSRGLGEVAAKLLMLGGARIALTYRHGATEAARLIEILREAGGDATARAFDAAGDVAAQLGDLPFVPTHFYYFATPPIFQAKSGFWDAARFHAFSAIYLDGFAALADFLGARGTRAGFWPSSVAAEEPLEELLEYGAVKLAGERLVAAIDARKAGPRLLTRRLPRIATDQTAANSPARTESAVAVLLPILDAMQALTGAG